MASLREGARMASTLGRRQLPLRTVPSCAARFTSTNAEKPANAFSDLDSASSFSTPSPDEKDLQAFNAAEKAKSRAKQLPGNRYQYHPPKYYRGPLHPVQVPPSSDPTARDFVPGPFNFPRLKHTYDTTIAPDLMTMTYTHVPQAPSFPSPAKANCESPRGGGSSRLGILERDIAWHNIPEIEAVTINSYAPMSSQNKEYLHVCRAVVQAVSGAFPEVTTIKHGVIQWHVRKGDKGGCKVTLKGGAAYEFIDKLVTLVLPKIKDWNGINASTGDDSGNLAFGLKPAWMAYFPEIEFNYDMYPARLMPGCDIFIKTTGTSDRQARLLMQALGFPFHGKATH
ncbi:ribosomal protein L5 domain-containing protein [Thelonectria olida]|uniref:Ribosomal protein L5 domain-containing protein n=1 Tax=Thelonectria olida TaxID=1576542 RepID=A0A9P8WAZ5_9HYPO|nr:ribosomal protein L5 domain-containing protein [Thelonectria olida]